MFRNRKTFKAIKKPKLNIYERAYLRAERKGLDIAEGRKAEQKLARLKLKRELSRLWAAIKSIFE